MLAALLGATPALAVPEPERRPPQAGVATSPAIPPLPERKILPLVATPDALPPLPIRKPQRAPVAAPEPQHPSEMEAAAWSDAEVAQAALACVELLKDVRLEFDLHPPLREGACGAPAPIQVTAVGDPAVKLVPAAVMTCPMAAALARWVREVLQPAARTHLGAPVARMRNASDYVCRTRYDTPGRRISEHARANAVDISVFETTQGETVSMLDRWHATVAAAPPPPERSPSRPPLQSALLELTADSAGDTEVEADALDEDDSPPPPPNAAPKPPNPDPRALFLRRVHDAACGHFATVLGPGANPAHADHFHFDMATRRHGPYCR